jgi:sugar phosphate isomerase/epimerase
MQIRGHDIGVCSWSIHPTDTADLIARVRELGLDHVQLALLPLLEKQDDAREQDLALLRDSGIKLTAGMISFPGEDYTTIAIIRGTGGYVPNDEWPKRKELSLRAARLGAAMGLSKISTHIGFVPPSSEKNYPIMIERVTEIAQAMSKHDITLLMETGQEDASELLQFLNDVRLPNVQVNFDPANMILYGAGDPIEAIGVLGRHIGHVHVKDAILSDQPRLKWGEEVPFGTGQVPPREFVIALERAGYRGPLVIEREAGDDRMRDVKFAIDTLRCSGA